MIAAALVLPDTIASVIEASATRRRSVPLTRNSASTTARESRPTQRPLTRDARPSWPLDTRYGGHTSERSRPGQPCSRSNKGLRCGYRRQALNREELLGHVTR